MLRLAAFAQQAPEASFSSEGFSDSQKRVSVSTASARERMSQEFCLSCNRAESFIPFLTPIQQTLLNFKKNSVRYKGAARGSERPRLDVASKIVKRKKWFGFSQRAESMPSVLKYHSYYTKYPGNTTDITLLSWTASRLDPRGTQRVQIARGNCPPPISTDKGNRMKKEKSHCTSSKVGSKCFRSIMETLLEGDYTWYYS